MGAVIRALLTQTLAAAFRGLLTGTSDGQAQDNALYCCVVGLLRLNLTNDVAWFKFGSIEWEAQNIWIAAWWSSGSWSVSIAQHVS